MTGRTPQEWALITTVSLACCMLAGAGCSSPDGEGAEETVGSARSALVAPITLHTFVNKSLEIDQITGGPGDAN